MKTLNGIKSNVGSQTYELDQTDCTGCDICVGIVPENFVVENEKAWLLDSNGDKVLMANYGSDDAERMQEAIDSCPASCIEVIG